MRTNEELVLLAQDGDQQATAELWQQNQEYISRHMRRYYRAASFRGLTIEDLTQEGYFGLLDAIRVFDPERGTPLLSYLHFYLKATAWKALGMARKTPFIVWIDQPLPGTEDFTLGDTLEDEQAAQEMESVVESVYHEQLHNCMERCLRTLKPKQQHIIRKRYHEGMKIDEVAADIQLEPWQVKLNLSESIWKLMRPKTSRQLLPFMYYEDPDYYRTDVQDHVEVRQEREQLQESLDELQEVERWLHPNGEERKNPRITLVGNTPPVSKDTDRGAGGGDCDQSAEAV